MKTIMILGGFASEVPVIKRAKEMGHNVVVVDRSDHVPGFEVEGIIAEHESIADKDKMLELAQKHHIDGILSSVDAGVRPAAYVAKVMGLPGISEEAAVMGTDKVAMRIRCKECGLPVPEFYIIKSKQDYMEAISKFPVRCVVKAADSSGSRGIYLLKDLKDTADVEYAFDYCKEFSSTGELLLEEFMEGPEICVETLSSDGICYPIQITDQLAKHPPYFTDSGYSQPSFLAPEMQELIRKIAIDTNMALENYQGSSCTELIVTRDGPKIVEVGVRLAGDFMTTGLVPLSTGVDMPGNVVKIALGEPIDVEPKYHKGSCIRYFMKERVGVIKEVKGISEAEKMPGVISVGILKDVGEEAKPLRKSSDRLGYVITQGENADQAIKFAENALNTLDFVVE